ncbi:MAG: hypothetical protein KDD45_03475 [Bdellovibrionales bacterium]|nr:hypothetical protein [Bdellovibrionales bacterium]
MEIEAQRPLKTSGSETTNKPKSLEDLPSIRLSPEQIEEIHADEYSLKLFYATRVQPLSLGETKRKFPEPTPKKAQSVLNRYVECGLVHITSDGKYYSNYPENYINYSDYKYDADLEAKKDAKVFELMKEHTGEVEYWKTKAYYSIDSFFTLEQTLELKEMFQQIKFKSKQFAHENAKKGKIDGLNFRRLKFYDMILSLVLILLIGVGFTEPSYAGNDPGSPMLMSQTNIHPIALNEMVDKILMSSRLVASGGGNDPGVIRAFASNDPTGGFTFAAFAFKASGGGHDPGFGDGGRSGGGHDPSQPNEVDDREECASELIDSKGELNEINLYCLKRIDFLMREECMSDFASSYCEVLKKIEILINQ